MTTPLERDPAVSNQPPLTVKTAGSPQVERRELDREHEAFVFHHNGGYQVRAGYTSKDAHDVSDAWRIAFVHNELRIHPTGAWRMRGAVPCPSNNG